MSGRSRNLADRQSCWGPCGPPAILHGHTMTIHNSIHGGAVPMCKGSCCWGLAMSRAGSTVASGSSVYFENRGPSPFKRLGFARPLVTVKHQPRETLLSMPKTHPSHPQMSDANRASEAVFFPVCSPPRTAGQRGQHQNFQQLWSAHGPMISFALQAKVAAARGLGFQCRLTLSCTDSSKSSLYLTAWEPLRRLRSKIISRLVGDAGSVLLFARALFDV